MNCPDCGHGNLPGTDACEHCGQDLRSVDAPRRRAGVQPRVLDTPLSALDPAEALTVKPSDPVGEVIRKMRAGRQGSAVIVDRGTVTGIFTERDALLQLTGRPVDLQRTPVETVMTRGPRVLKDDDTLALALHYMTIGGYRHIPVARDGKPLGFVSIRGVLRYLSERSA
jgi:CBS domain-containing protein